MHVRRGGNVIVVEEKQDPSTAEADALDIPAATSDRVRDTVKWLVVAFAASGAALIAGSVLTGFGRATGARLAAAVLGYVAGLGGVGASIWYATRILGPSTTTLPGLVQGKLTPSSIDGRAATVVEEMPELFQRHGPTLGELREQFEESQADRKAVLDASLSDPEDQRKQQVAQVHAARAQWLSGVVDEILRVAALHKVWFQFRDTLRPIAVSVAVAALGVALFAWAANPPESVATRVDTGEPSRPMLIAITLSGRGEQLLADNGGAECLPSGAVQALLLSSSGAAADVVTIPTKTCRAVRLVLTPDVGTAVPVSPAEIPAASR